jgi:hypothetical protein
MVNQQHLDILEKGVGVWNQWRQDMPEIIPDLEAANLRNKSLDLIDLHKANMKHIDFYRTSLRGANLCEADFHMAHLYRTDFSDADLSKAMLRGADLVRANLIRVSLYEADLRWVKLGENDLSGADLTKSAVYGASAWDIKLDDVKQSSLDITKDKTQTIIVDNLETAQLIHLLRNYKKVGSVINSVKKKGVLILGRFSNNGDKVLHLIADQLRDEYDYLPMIFDFNRPDTLDHIETVVLLAALSKFVIVDLSGRSVPHELQATVPNIQIPFVPIIDQRRREHFTFSVFNKYQWVVSPIFRFTSEAHLMLAMQKSIIEPAEKKIKELIGQGYDKEIKSLEILNIFDGENLLQEEESVLNIEERELEMYEFRSFRKTALLKARVLTDDDYKKKNGTIKTLEGVATFMSGDYLMLGIDNEEWPMTQDSFHVTYEKISAFDREGFALYRTNDIRLAYQVLEAFAVKRTNGDVLYGKAGDYLVKSGDRSWVTDRDIFERSYEPVSY